MGNANGSSDSSNPFYASDGNKQSELTQLLQEFSFVSVYEDELFGRCSVIEHRDSKELIITKEVSCESDQEMEKLHQEFQNRKTSLTNVNLLRLRYAVRKKTVGLFTDQFKLILFFDYVVTSLTAEYGNRLKTQKYFSSEEINIITCGALRGYAALQGSGIPNTKVRPSNIYFGLQSGMPLPKIIDSRLFPTSTNLQSIKKQQNVQDVFLAPEQLKNMDQPNYSNAKSGVFSLGVSLMQMCLLTPSSDMYNYSKRSINYAQLENRLNIIKNKYPLSIYCLFRDMLERNDDSRPSFTKLSESLPTNLKNLPATLNISLMKNNGAKTNASMTQGSKFLANSTANYSKVINPLSNSRSSSRRMQTSLASQYRPDVQTSEVYTNGNRYEGQKKDNFRHGRGKYIYNDGSYYMGDWLKGKMEGTGQLFDSQGNLIYDGKWKDDHYEGSGRLMGYGTDWTKYEGEFRCGKKQGFGEMWFQDGKRYKGQFRNDVPSGKGRMFARNGDIQTGIWEKGNFISQF